MLRQRFVQKIKVKFPEQLKPQGHTAASLCVAFSLHASFSLLIPRRLLLSRSPVGSMCLVLSHLVAALDTAGSSPLGLKLPCTWLSSNLPAAPLQPLPQSTFIHL